MGELQKRDVSARACVCRSGSLVAFRVSHGSFAHPTSFAAYFLNSSQYFSLDILFASLPYNRLKVPMIGLNYFLRKSKKKKWEQGSVTLSSQVLPVFKNTGLV